MKNATFTILGLILIATMSSCGVGAAYVFNHNQNATQVQLGSNNFKVVNKVKGRSEVSYVLIFGGAKKKQLYASAYSQMVDSSTLTGAQALANVMTEEHIGGVPPFFYKRTITVSAHVIEFTD